MRQRRPPTCCFQATVQPEQATPQAATAPSASPVDLIDKTLDLAAQAGGVIALKRLADRLADMQHRIS